MNNTVKLGLILGGIGIAVSLIYRYVIGGSFIFNPKSWLITILISAIVMIFLGRKLLRDPEEDRLSFGQAVKGLFIAFLIASALSLVAQTLLYGGDEQMQETFVQSEKEMQEGMLRWMGGLFGQSEAEQEAAIDQARESGQMESSGYPYVWSKFPITYGVGAIGNLLFSLLLALFVREKETSHA